MVRAKRRNRQHYWLSRVPAVKSLQQKELAEFESEVTLPPAGPPKTASVEILWIQGTIISQTIGECEIDVRMLSAKAGG